jgi:hypothetical protein
MAWSIGVPDWIIQAHTVETIVDRVQDSKSSVGTLSSGGCNLGAGIVGSSLAGGSKWRGRCSQHLPAAPSFIHNR